MKYFTTAQLAKELKVHKNSIFYWERTGKIPKPKRQPISNYRVWTEQEVKKIKALRKK
ncbi:MAG: MerR family transcriptional regulator [Deltaproteobacteria bacterium]|nr:MerR family transcriptional regulator [Deltaproteobacteria bacterium]